MYIFSHSQFLFIACYTNLFIYHVPCRMGRKKFSLKIWKKNEKKKTKKKKNMTKKFTPYTLRWNVQLIDQLFPKETAAVIKSIPLGWRTTRNSCLWRWSRNGAFSVRSAYYNIQVAKEMQTSSSAASSFPWKKLWRTPVPNKMKHFAYRVARNIIPCRENLQRRGIAVQNECPTCNHQIPESMSHLFLHCQWSRAAWFASQIGHRTDTIQMSFTDWFKKICLERMLRS